MEQGHLQLRQVLQNVVEIYFHVVDEGLFFLSLEMLSTDSAFLYFTVFVFM